MSAELWQEIEQTRVQPGTVVLWWLYQSGVAVKTPGGTVALVDPYLSDSVLRSYGLLRAVPAPLDPAQATPTRCWPRTAMTITSTPTASARS